MKVLIVLLFSILILSGCNNKNYTSENLYNNLNSNNTINEITADEFPKPQELAETNLSTFSTKISQKDPNRQTNITLACQSLNGIIVKAGETFSFCDTLGPAKPEDGYLKADTFDSDGNTIQAYGGGKCQVSTTLYNAVLIGERTNCY